VWTGKELSEPFSTHTGVKQGCLLSPTLFALFLNDLHEYLGGGINIDDLNVRVLLYADDLVILADDVAVLQNMIKRLELYCETWGMEVNPEKSKIMVFQKGGRTSAKEKWFYKQEEIEKVSEYKYLGIILTPALSFNKHIKNRNSQAKSKINSTWVNFLSKKGIALGAKWKLFLAVCRSIQAYGAQVWGYCGFEEVDLLQRFFLKRILKLPANTPNYVLALEGELQEAHIYTLSLHLHYIYRTIFEYNDSRLPHLLSLKIIQKKLF